MILLQEGGKDGLHDNQVLVNFDGVDLVLWGELELKGRNLPVPGFEWDSYPKALVLDLFHSLKEVWVVRGTM